MNDMENSVSPPPLEIGGAHYDIVTGINQGRKKSSGYLKKALFIANTWSHLPNPKESHKGVSAPLTQKIQLRFILHKHKYSYFSTPKKRILIQY